MVQVARKGSSLGFSDVYKLGIVKDQIIEREGNSSQASLAPSSNSAVASFDAMKFGQKKAKVAKVNTEEISDEAFQDLCVKVTKRVTRN